MSEHDASDKTPFLCARCGAELTPGKGDFYVVRIEALADPTPPTFSEEDMKHDPRAEIERLIEQMRDLSEQELLDQVYRRLVVYLCGPCYRQWIENPVG
jgi:DNA-directed RNA polymerase subunit RPC12/RpoP